MEAVRLDEAEGQPLGAQQVHHRLLQDTGRRDLGVHHRSQRGLVARSTDGDRPQERFLVGLIDLVVARQMVDHGSRGPVGGFPEFLLPHSRHLSLPPTAASTKNTEYLLLDIGAQKRGGEGVCSSGFPSLMPIWVTIWVKNNRYLVSGSKLRMLNPACACIARRDADSILSESRSFFCSATW